MTDGRKGEQKKPKAGERLDALEVAFSQQSEMLTATARRVGEMEIIMYNISRENEMLKDALQLTHEKLDAVITLQNEGQPLSTDNINAKVTEMKELALKQKIDDMVENGNIEPVDTVEENSLIVSRELSKEGELVNPRLQFMVGRLVEELKSKFVGKKAGDMVEGEGDKLNIEILEIYKVVEQQIPAQQEVEEGTEETTSSEES